MKKAFKKAEVKTVAKAEKKALIDEVKEDVTRRPNVRGAVGVLLKSHRMHSTSWFSLMYSSYLLRIARMYGCRSPTNRAGLPHGEPLEA